ncbi:4-hydroxybenzoate synthetase [Cohnella silvisoli]|uniref:4-hydroxybenzoate synthetase n=1 Tax=Cohnella silvisoli TaxID=2873699 RepID=A0ABV1L3I0_9BACL|nr:4-hydroxybenzoate synthetase [Cohnella silvisoli]MCD9026461.1 4-hydroxybenzoate synthetase [Cohnella silvisoli]
MTRKEIKDIDSGFDFLHRLVFNILLITDGRTTDILETLMDETMSLQVVRQEQINDEQTAQLGEDLDAPYYVRESILIGAKSQLVISHNIALVCSKYLPSLMFEAIAAKQEGIGKTISTFGLQTSRKVVDSGWRKDTETVDLFYKPLKLRFSPTKSKVPYKKYSIDFGTHPGIYLLEYFNPNIVLLRLKQLRNESHGADDQIPLN